jgi:PAT family beta-lactamase induction signal transducer AmpG
MTEFIRLFCNRRSLALFLLGIASGVPLAVSGDLLAAWLTDQHIDMSRVGMFGLVGLPYFFKALWSPLVDRFTPPLLGRRRGWITLTQLALVGSILLLSETAPGLSLKMVALAATLVAFLGATQDIVTDALRADILPPDERGPGIAVSVAGYRLGMVVTAAGAMILVGKFSLSWQQACRIVAALMSIGLIGVWLAPEPSAPQSPKTLYQAVGEPLVALLTRRGGILIVLFAFLFKLPEHIANAMSLPFLMRIGLPTAQIGAVREGLGVLVTIAGAFVGGGVVSRLGLWRSLWLFGTLHSISNLAFFVLAETGKSYRGMVAVVGIENFCVGLTTAAFLAWMISLCDRGHSAFQFALLSSLMALSRILCSPLAGAMAHWMGWPAFFAVSPIFGVPGLLLLFWIRPDEPVQLKVTAAKSPVINGPITIPELIVSE